jgi:hypothetical protein
LPTYEPPNSPCDPARAECLDALREQSASRFRVDHTECITQALELDCDARSVAQRSIPREGLFDQGARHGVVALPYRYIDHSLEGCGASRRCGILRWHCQQFLEVSPTFLLIATGDPVVSERDGQPQRCLDLARFDPPPDDLAKVVQFSIERGQPEVLSWTAEVLGGRSREIRKISSVRSGDLGHLTGNPAVRSKPGRTERARCTNSATESTLRNSSGLRPA